MIPTSISEGSLCSLLSLLIQMLISSGNTITDTPRPSEHPLAQLSRQVTLRCMYIYIYIYIYTHTYIYTHRHTPLCAQLCPTLCDTLDWSLPSSSVMGFSRQESWIGLPFPAPGESSRPRGQTCISCVADRFFTHWAIREAHTLRYKSNKICCCCSVTQSCPTLWNPMDNSTPGFPVLHYLPESAKTHMHWVGDTIQPSYPLLTPSPPTLNLSQHQGLFQWVSSSHKVAKVLELQPQSSVFPMRIKDWFPLGLTGLISLLSKGLSRIFSNITVWKH